MPVAAITVCSRARAVTFTISIADGTDATVAGSVLLIALGSCATVPLVAGVGAYILLLVL